MDIPFSGRNRALFASIFLSFNKIINQNGNTLGKIMKPFIQMIHSGSGRYNSSNYRNEKFQKCEGKKGKDTSIIHNAQFTASPAFSPGSTCRYRFYREMDRTSWKITQIGCLQTRNNRLDSFHKIIAGAGYVCKYQRSKTRWYKY